MSNFKGIILKHPVHGAYLYGKDQPLKLSKQFIILHKLDENLKLVISAKTGKPALTLKPAQDQKFWIQDFTVIGFVD